METSQEMRRYLSRIGSRGGKKSRRVLTPEQSRAMLQMREYRRSLRRLDAIPDPIKRAQAYGIDISLLEANLALSPAQRLEQHDQAVMEILELQQFNATKAKDAEGARP